MTPVISVKADLVTKNENYIYVPIASRASYGTVKVGSGLLITDGVISLDGGEVPVLTISKNGVDIIPDENKRVNIELTKNDIGLSMVDNTADMDKPISVAQRTEFDKKINTYQGPVYADKVLTVGEDGYVTLKSVGVTLDKFAMDGLRVNRKNDGLSIDYTSFNLKTLANKTDSVLLPLASDAESGLMSSADYASIRDLQSRMNRVENRASKLFYEDTMFPTAEEINAFVEEHGFAAPFEGISVLVEDTHHIWHYYENAGWIDDGIDIVDQFTNATLGVIKGSSAIGKIYAETDGTGSVNGWDVLVGRVDGLDGSYTSVGDEITKQTKRIDGVYERADGLEADIQDLQGQIDEIHTDNLVDLETSQEIGGVKTFKNQVGFKNEDGTIDYIKHINNNLLISTSTGENLLNIDEGLKRAYFFNKEVAFKEDIAESSGTTVKVGGVAVAEFNADTKVDKNSVNTVKTLVSGTYNIWEMDAGVYHLAEATKGVTIKYDPVDLSKETYLYYGGVLVVSKIEKSSATTFIVFDAYYMRVYNGFANASGGSIQNLVVNDSELSTTSINGIQNKVVTEAINQLKTPIPDYDTGWFKIAKASTYSFTHDLKTMNFYALLDIVYDNGTNYFYKQGVIINPDGTASSYAGGIEEGSRTTTKIHLTTAKNYAYAQSRGVNDIGTAYTDFTSNEKCWARCRLFKLGGSDLLWK